MKHSDGASEAEQVSQPVRSGAGGPIQANRTNILNVNDIWLQVKVNLLQVKVILLQVKVFLLQVKVIFFQIQRCRNL